MIEKFKTSLKIKTDFLDIHVSKTPSGIDVYNLNFIDEKFGRIRVKFLSKTHIQSLKDLEKKMPSLKEVTLGFFGTPFVDDNGTRPAILSIGILLSSDEDIFKIVEMVEKPSIIDDESNNFQLNLRLA